MWAGKVSCHLPFQLLLLSNKLLLKSYWLKITNILLCSQVLWVRNADREQWGDSVPLYLGHRLRQLEGWVLESCGGFFSHMSGPWDG